MPDESRRSYPDAVLGVLSCQIGLRPPDAPHFSDLASAVREVRRDGRALVVDYDPAVRAALIRVVEAERLCCSGIGWAIEPVGATLRATASPEQLDVLANLVGVPEGDAA